MALGASAEELCVLHVDNLCSCLPSSPCSYVLFVLPKLRSLDTLLLADETKQLAEATFLKKQMYYNMRMKTTCRNARNAIKVAVDGRQVRLDGTGHSFNPKD